MVFVKVSVSPRRNDHFERVAMPKGGAHNDLASKSPKSHIYAIPKISDNFQKLKSPKSLNSPKSFNSAI